MTLDGAVSMGRVSQRPVPKFHQRRTVMDNVVEIVLAIVGVAAVGVSAIAALLFTMTGM